MATVYPEKPIVTACEIVIWSLFAAGLWFASFTFLSPLFLLLIFSSWLRNVFFSCVFTLYNTNKRWRELPGMRQNLFDRIRQQCSSGANKDKKLRFLEIGVGPGANFRFYTKNDVVTLLDKNPEFRNYVEKELKKYPEVSVDRFVVSMSEDMREIADEEYDVVVCTHLFCSVANRRQVMREMKRVLKPGGKLAFLEHIGYPKDHIGYRIQKVISPLWYIVGNGCRLDRCWKEDLKKVFPESLYDVIYPNSVPMILRPHAIGLASK